MSSSAKPEARRTLDPSPESRPSSVDKSLAADEWVSRVLFGLAALCLVLGVVVWRVLLTEIPHDDSNPQPHSVRSSMTHPKD